jgi:hypothetical protein
MTQKTCLVVIRSMGHFGRRVYSGTDLVIASSPAPAYGIASQYARLTRL